MQFYDAAGSWSRVERIIARLEAGARGHRHPLYRHQPRRRPRQARLRTALLRPRPSRKPHQGVEEHLAADRTSCHAAEANQFRLFLHAGAYWLLWSMRRVMPKHSVWRVMQFDTLRLRLVKLAARIVELKTQIKIHLPSSAPDQAIFAMLLDRLPRLVT
jgi:Transposase DDE domain group 1